MDGKKNKFKKYQSIING